MPAAHSKWVPLKRTQTKDPVMFTSRNSRRKVPAAHSKWVPLKRTQSTGRAEYPTTVPQQHVEQQQKQQQQQQQQQPTDYSQKYVEPLRVTVRNDNASSLPAWMIEQQQQNAATSSSRISPSMDHSPCTGFVEILHRLRMKVEASKMAKENLVDNY
ncbi:unnamed protein product, partial [Gongylonema pulchrum]|uniref:Uncharacterized protein n=1 Tax=Gongylonema pulchrum TaxID=637853 RepID=A0A183ENM6_9BILA